MPYITKEKRAPIDEHIDLVAWNVDSPGEINYAISRLLASYLACNSIECYEGYNAIIGILTAVQLEFYRTVVAPYEDKKRLENGNVLDTPGGGGIGPSGPPANRPPAGAIVSGPRKVRALDGRGTG